MPRINMFRFALQCLGVASLALLSLVSPGLPVPAAAQTGKGVLSGVVLNSQGKPVASALVYYQDAAGEKSHALRTDANGHFRSRPVNPNLYDLRAEAGGMSSEWTRNVIVRGGEEYVMLRLVRATAPKP